MNLAVAAHAKNPYDEPVTRSNDKKTETAANCAVQGTGNPERQATAAIHVDEL